MKAKLRVFITSWLLLAGCYAQAQTADSLARYPHLIGINSTIFVKNFLSISSTNEVFNDPYVLVYKYVGKLGGTFRTGIGFNYLSTTNSINGNTGLTPDSSVRAIYFRIGYEKQLPIGKAWNFYFGTDGRYEQTRTRIKTQVTSTPPGQVSTKETIAGRWGIGFLAGVEFKLHRRISFMAEASSLLFYEETHKRFKDNRFPSLDSDEFTAKQFFDFSYPTSIYLIIKL